MFVGLGLGLVSCGAIVAAVSVPSGSPSASGAAGSSVAPVGEPAPPPAVPQAPAIPPGLLALEKGAAATCPGLDWSLLAALVMEQTGPALDGDQLRARFGSGSPDSLSATAEALCADGAGHTGDAYAAVLDLEGTVTRAESVVVLSRSIGADPSLSAPAAAAISFAAEQLGKPYLWGGTGVGGFDCSGLTQAAYAAAGIAIPRTSTTQWTTLPHVPLAALSPGDLVFFEPGEFSPGLPGHVGLSIGDGEMIDAPHTGTDVQVDDLSDWTAPLGAARPLLAAG